MFSFINIKTNFYGLMIIVCSTVIKRFIYFYPNRFHTVMFQKMMKLCFFSSIKKNTVVLYCWCHSDGALVLLYFT